MFRSLPTHIALCLLTLTAVGCAGGVDAVESGEVSEAVESPVPPKSARLDQAAISVSAESRTVSAGTPTYGYTPTEELLRIEVRVVDAALRAQHPGFDGFERAFALVPRHTEHGVQWESHAVPFAYQTRQGYYAQEVVDAHRTDWLRGLDVDAALTHGIAIGLDTNVGTLWAQAPGENWPVVPR